METSPIACDTLAVHNSPLSTVKLPSISHLLDKWRGKREALMDAFLAGRKFRTLEMYRYNAREFQKFLGAKDLNQAAYILISLPHGDANALAFSYKAHQICLWCQRP